MVEERGMLSSAPWSASRVLRKKEHVSGRDDDIPLLSSKESDEACVSASMQTIDADEALRNQSITKTSKERLASLDVFRGLTIAVMILVDDAGGLWPSINHSPWHGITLADYVMPFFLFIVGMSVVLALKNAGNKFTAFEKAGLRALKLFVIGLALQGGYFHGADNLSFGIDMKRFRIMGILQRISCGYLLVACCEIFAKGIHVGRKTVTSFQADSVMTKMMYPWHWASVLVISCLYLSILYGLRVPDWHFNVALHKDFALPAESNITTIKCDVRGDLGPACNAVGFLDRTILGIDHLYANPVYRRTKDCSTNSPGYGPPPVNAPAWCFTPFDPEGLLSSLAASISCFIGAHYGHILVHHKNHKTRLCKWIGSGIFLYLLGLVIEWFGMPINKPLYTISYLCVTGGAAGLVFSAIYVLVDMWNYRMPFLLLLWMGMNALLIFVLAAIEAFPALVQGFYWGSPENNLVSFVEVGVFQHVIHSEKWAKMAFVLCEILFWCLICGVLKHYSLFWKL